ncbi:hypothetical protein ACHWQZ_G001371 [Mnemiopsis leidyi]
MSLSTPLLVSLLCVLLLQVNAGARCKNICQLQKPTVEGASIESLTLAFPMETDCSSEDFIQCDEGYSCFYTRRQMSAKGEGTSDEIGIFDDVGCHASADSVVSCEMYEATFPMDLGFVVLELDSCETFVDDGISWPGEEGKEEETEQEAETPLEGEGEGEEGEGSGGDADKEPIVCTVCKDVVKVDADGQEETLESDSPSCSDPSKVTCPADVTSCASITATYADSDGMNYRISAKSCRVSDLTCESESLIPEEGTLTDCEVADHEEKQSEENETENEDSGVDDNDYTVIEEEVKGTSQTILSSSALLILSFLTQFC